MSDIAVTWAKAQANVDGTPVEPLARQVLVYMASWADAAGYAWASVPVLAFETGKSERTVQRGLARLKALGLLLETGRTHLHLGRLYPVYRMPLEAGPANTLQARKEAREADAGAVGGAARGDTHVTPSGAAGCHPCHPTGDADVTPRGDTHVTQRGKELSQGNSTPGARAGEGDADFEAVLAAWAGKAPERASRVRSWPAWRAVLDRTAMPPGRLRAAAERALARDPDFGRGKAMNLDRWLAEDRWEPWLAEIEAGPAGGKAARAAAGLPTGPWEGPAEVRAAVLAAIGPAGVASYLDPAGWRADGRVILARTRLAAERLGRQAGAALAAAGVRVELAPREREA